MRRDHNIRIVNKFGELKIFELSKKVRIQASFQRQIIFCFVHPNQLIQVQDVTGMSSTDNDC